MKKNKFNTVINDSLVLVEGHEFIHTTKDGVELKLGVFQNEAGNWDVILLSHGASVLAFTKASRDKAVKDFKDSNTYNYPYESWVKAMEILERNFPQIKFPVN